MEQSTRFVGMDVHKETIVVAVTASGEVGKATAYGTFPNTTAGLEKLVKRLRQAGDGPIKFCYEAGPCGYGVHRTLTRMGEDCMVVAPSMIPRKSGERQKTDKRDAANLAVLHRGGLLTPVWVPDAAHEAMRDLIRAPQAAVRAVRAARQQLSAFLLRHERIYPDGKKAWTKVHRRWLAEQSFAQPAQQIVLEESIEAVRLGEQRRDRVDGYLRADPDMVAVSSGAEPVRLAWSGHDRRCWPGGGDWRPLALCVSTRLHGLSRHSAIRTYLRAEAAHRCHHQSW
jgi:transposase